MPDLTVRIVRGATPGSVLWTFDTPHNLELPGEAAHVDLGLDPESFTRRLIAGVETREIGGAPDLVPYLRGVGSRVADKVPKPFWDLLRAVSTVADAERSRPSVLVLSAEPHVPWELALVDPPLDDAAPPFLASQVTLGRWVLMPRRPAEPPSAIHGRTLVVVAGSCGEPLEAAVEEVAALKRKWSATEVAPTLVDVLRYLAGDPPGDIFHYAGHGEFAADDAVEDGLLLNDGEWLVPDAVRGHHLAAAPFVFLNACQVGATADALGDASGMAEAFIYAGAVGVIAPLWSVLDGHAKELALRFYDEAFNGRPPAEILRDARAALGPDLAATTPLAFRYFGHPALAVRG